MTEKERFIGKYYVGMKFPEPVMPGKLMRIIDGILGDNKGMKGSLTEKGRNGKKKKLG